MFASLLLCLQSGGSEPRGISVDGDTLYLCEYGDDNLYKVNKTGSAPSVRTEVSYNLPDGDTFDGITGIHFFLQGKVIL